MNRPELGVVVVASAVQAEASEQVVLEGGDGGEVDVGDVEEQRLVLAAAEGATPVVDTDVVRGFDGAEGRAQSRGERIEAAGGGVAQFEAAAGVEYALEFQRVADVERADDDAALDAGVVGRRAQQPIQHRADAAELSASFVGDMDEEVDGGRHQGSDTEKERGPKAARISTSGRRRRCRV